MKRILLGPLLAYLLLPLSLFATGVTSPDAFLGFHVGQDRHLADWRQISAYFELLDSESDRFRVEVIGRSTEGREMIVGVISAPENLRWQESIKSALQKLADPRKLRTGEVESLLASTPAVILINCSIHANEIAASQYALELAYHLASQDNAETVQILQNTVILLLPSANPDGIARVVDWYRRSLGTRSEGLHLPELDHHYAGHDSNRDWFMLNLPETQAVTRLLYREWYPQIVLDLHEMSDNNMRMIIPPFYDITNPLIDPLILNEITLAGGFMATTLTSAGFTGIVNRTRYDMWWHGGFRTAPYFHNVVGLLAETASARLATPDTLPPGKFVISGSVLADLRAAASSLAPPWPGGVWRLRNVIDMEKTVTRAMLQLTASHRKMWLENFYLMAKRAIEQGEQQAPRAYILPRRQHDPASARELVRRLQLQGIEVEQAETRFRADGELYPEGTLIIRTAQPYRANVIALLDVQKFQAKRLSPGSPPKAPYDVAAWSLPHQMGVQVVAAQQIGAVPTRLLPDLVDWPVQQTFDPGAAYWVLHPGSNDSYRAVNHLLRAGVPVHRSRESVFQDSSQVVSGSVYIPITAPIAEQAKSILSRLSVSVRSLPEIAQISSWQLAMPRIGVYHSNMADPDEGWTHFVLEDFEFDPAPVSAQEIRAGRLNARFDVLILPSMRYGDLLNGHIYKERGRSYAASYCGGIGQEGVRQLQEFVRNGGDLLLFGEAIDIATQASWLNVHTTPDDGKRLFAPGSLLEVSVDPQHPIGYGMRETTAVMFLRNKAMAAGVGKSVATYTGRQPLISGYLLGGHHLYGKSALTVVSNKSGAGRVVLYGFRPQHRGQTHATLKLVFNALYLSTAREATLGRPLVTE